MKLSVITINLNNGKGLSDTIQSIKEQTFSDFEYIIIDGGSSDNSIEIIRSNSDYIKKWVSEKDSGIYNAMNKGVNLSEGEYLLFLNSGDQLASTDVLEKILSTPVNVDIFYGNMLIDESNEQRLGKMPVELSRRHMVRDTLWHPVSFIRKELFTKNGMYDETLRIVGDYDFFLRSIFIDKASTLHIDIPIAIFHTDGISSRPENREMLVKERYAVQQRYFTPSEIERLLHISIFEKINNKLNALLK
jgi:glycosyltransferase involved in cell wall biosynthesis